MGLRPPQTVPSLNFFWGGVLQVAVELVAESPPAPPESPRPRCVRVGCDRPPIESSEWDSEYCSSECVVRHCRDVFLAWLAARNANNNVVFVK